MFLKGCPLRCAWCHNPEAISARRELVVMEGRCVVCGRCGAGCPQSGEAALGLVWPVRQEGCTFCGSCAEACPTGARQIIGQTMTVSEVMKRVRQDRVFYEESGGGVTFSGGEPFLQAQFLGALLERCRRESLPTAVDTCGFGDGGTILGLASLVDLFLFDLKLMDDAAHQEFCGVSNRSILENLLALGNGSHRIWLRVPVVPGVTDRSENLSEIARLAGSLPGVEQVNILPYHRTGVGKLARLGRENLLGETSEPDRAELDRAAGFFRAEGCRVRIGG